MNINTRSLIRAGVIFIIIGIIGVISYNVYLSFERSGKQKIELVIAPNDADVSLTHTQTKKITKSHHGTVYVEPGTYRISVQKNGFRLFEKTQDITKDNTVIAELLPETAEAKKWAKNHQDQYQKLSIIAGKKAREYGEKLTATYPLFAALPIKDAYYSIGRSIKNGEQIVLITTPSPQYRYVALRRIVRMGYKLSDYKIEFKDFKNPLEAQ